MSDATTTDPFADPVAARQRVAGVRPAHPGDVAAAAAAGRVPGEMGIWVFAFMDMWFFTGLMGVAVYNRGQEPAVFEAGRQSLTLWEGTFNTLLLLTASYAVVLGLRRLRAERSAAARNMFRLAQLCALGFVINKGIEYSHLLGDGHDPGESTFYLFFFILTGFHLLHLLVGTLALRYMSRATTRPSIDAKGYRNLEVAATYWHLVDLLWVVIFAVLYLMR